MATTALTYRVTPPAAFVNTSTSLTITASNGTGSDINFGRADEIQIAFPIGTMVVNLNFTASTPSGSDYSAGKSSGGNYFSVKAPFGFTLHPGDTMTITFDQVPIVGTPVSNVNIGITEYIGSNDPATTSLPFEVKSAGLGIIAWLDKLVVGQGQPATLYWQSSGGTQVVITGFPTGDGQKTFPVQGNPPYPGNTTVYVPSQPNDPQQWQYTATVYSGGGDSRFVVLVLQQNPPIINSFTSSPNVTTLRVDAPVTLNWHVQFAASVILTTPTIPNWRQPINALPFNTTPGADIYKAYNLNFSQMPKSATYILTANGFSQPATQAISFELEPVKLLYFKFANDNLTGVVYKTDPPQWAFQLIPSANLNTFTLYQPGGTADVFYLGSGDTTHPQIQYFNFTPNSGKFTLQWITANLASLVLNPGNIQIAAGQIANGNLEVDAPGTYTLTGTTASGLSVDSVLVVS